MKGDYQAFRPSTNVDVFGAKHAPNRATVRATAATNSDTTSNNSTTHRSKEKINHKAKTTATTTTTTTAAASTTLRSQDRSSRFHFLYRGHHGLREGVLLLIASLLSAPELLVLPFPLFQLILQASTKHYPSYGDEVNTQGRYPRSKIRKTKIMRRKRSSDQRCKQTSCIVWDAARRSLNSSICRGKIKRLTTAAAMRGAHDAQTKYGHQRGVFPFTCDELEKEVFSSAEQERD